GAGCWQLTQDCSITQAQLEQFNSHNSAFCSHLVSGQTYCCTSGGLPPTGPSPSANGTCALYYVKSGDTCSAIAQATGTNYANYDAWNANNWQWHGCSGLLPGDVIC
ncbi:hypothetical protein DFJ73DRAFT_599287, partial [Zopfochytrium polystomum]